MGGRQDERRVSQCIYQLTNWPYTNVHLVTNHLPQPSSPTTVPHLQVRDEHPKLRAPIPHMVHPQHIVPTELQHPTDCIADDGRPQVPHVHLLGDVGGREIHQDVLLGHGGRFYPLGEDGLDGGEKQGGTEGDVDEAVGGDGGVGDEGVDGEAGCGVGGMDVGEKGVSGWMGALQDKERQGGG